MRAKKIEHQASRCGADTSQWKPEDWAAWEEAAQAIKLGDPEVTRHARAAQDGLAKLSQARVQVGRAKAAEEAIKAQHGQSVAALSNPRELRRQTRAWNERHLHERAGGDALGGAMLGGLLLGPVGAAMGGLAGAASYRPAPHRSWETMEEALRTELPGLAQGAVAAQQATQAALAEEAAWHQYVAGALAAMRQATMAWRWRSGALPQGGAPGGRYPTVTPSA